MKVEIGPYDLVYSDLIIQVGDDPIKITLNDSIEGDFIFHIYFITETQGIPVIGPGYNQAQTRFTQIDLNNLKIDFINFNQANNMGNTELLHLGTLYKKNLFLNYRVFELTNVGKSLMVNFYTQR